MVLHVRGTVLPEREARSLWIDGGVLREAPVADAETVADGGWLLPGLVDVHTHPGAEQPGDPFDESVLRTDLAEHAAAGVLLIRAPGSAARIPGWAHDADGLPRVRSAGPWLATPGRFFRSWGRHVTEAELAAAAAEEAAAAPEAAGMPEATGPAGRGPGDGLETGQRTSLGTGQAAVTAPSPAPAAGVDSLEHGLHLDPGLLHQMAAQGTALVPTLNAFAAAAFRVRAWDPGPRRDSFLAGWAAMPAGAAAAHEAGVTVLAGTDTHPCGTVAEEVERLIGAGLPRAAAVGAASWTARAWLGLPGLTDGAPADLVIYDEDPVAHPDILHHPRLIILRGQILA